MATIQELRDRLANTSAPFDDRSKQNIMRLAMTRQWDIDQAIGLVDEAESVAAGEAAPPPGPPSEWGASVIKQVQDGKGPPAQLPTAIELDLMLAPPGEARPQDVDPENVAELLNNVRAEKAARNRTAQLNEVRKERVNRDYAGVNQSLALDPVGAKVRSPKVLVSPFGMAIPLPENMELPSDDPSRLAEQARLGGVDVRTGAPIGPRVLGSLADLPTKGSTGAYVPGLQYLTLDKELRAQSGVPDSVPVIYKEPNTGGLMYLRKVTQDDIVNGRDPEKDLGKLRPTLINQTGLDWGDIAEYAPDFVSGGLEAGAAIGTGVLTGGLGAGAALLSSSVVGSVFAGMTRPAKVALLKEFSGLTDEEIERSGAVTDFDSFSAAVSGFGEAGVGTFLGLKHWVKNNKRFLSEEDYKELRAAVEKNKQLFERVEARTGVRIISDRPVAPKELLTESPEVLTQAAAIHGRQPAIRTRERIAERVRTDQRVGRAVRNLINDNIPGNAYTPAEIQAMEATQAGILRPGASSSDTSFKVKETAIDPLKRATADADAAEAALEQAINPLPTDVNRGLYISMQSATDENVKTMAENSSKLWNQFDKLVDFHPGLNRAGVHLDNPGNSEIRLAGARLAQQAEVALSQGSATKKVRLLDDLEILMKSPTVDMKQLHVVLSELKQTSRQMDKGLADGIGFAKKDVDDMIRAIEWQVENGKYVRTRTGAKLQRRSIENIKDAWRSASEATMQYKKVGQAASVREMLKTKPVFQDGKLVGYRFDTLPNEVKAAMFKANDASALVNIIEAASYSPELKAGLGQELLREYRTKVAPEGQWKQLGHDQFMAEYGDHLEILFGRDGSSAIRNVETFGRQVDIARDRATRVKEVIDRRLGGLVDTSDPNQYSANLAETVMTKSNVNAGHVDRLMADLEKADPKMAAEVRGHVGEWLGEQLLDGKRPLSPKQYEMLLRKHGDKIGKVMGGGFVSDLKDINSVLRVLEAEGLEHGPRDPVQASWLQITRSFFGPMDPIQRKATAFNRAFRTYQAWRISKVLGDPDKLKRFIKLKKLDPRSLVFRSEMYNLVGQELTDAVIGPDPDMDKKIAHIEQLRSIGTYGLP